MLAFASFSITIVSYQGICVFSFFPSLPRFLSHEALGRILRVKVQKKTEILAYPTEFCFRRALSLRFDFAKLSISSFSASSTDFSFESRRNFSWDATPDNVVLITF